MVAKKITRKLVQTKPSFKFPIGKGPHPLYGMPIREVTKVGSLTQMRKMATMARSHVKDVTAALAKLDAQIKKGGGR